ncbi:nucleotidyltransferase domain-containing protein [Nocardiopsis ansamitocini]|uniref:Nucleotidyltransferase n=1 Tax=Nocardiopsis ansamitocini TaxID=1670832 RepID=A0A9W6P9K0_9ACTN|nr:nucleotidyltransferase domain-containing protein [Nocardiopsis ansamitocini]GLU49478.1 nucleotidyltransferase [Nocardiopsis ansamitocini]
MDPLEAAIDLLWKNHPDARAAFLAGSSRTPRRTPTSDLDIVVILTGPPAPYRESLVHREWPVEVFAHTEASWHSAARREAASRCSPLLSMCATGELLIDVEGTGASIARQARARLAAGPSPATPGELEDARYALTDLVDDLTGCTDTDERGFIAAETVRSGARLVLLVRREWSGAGKWLSQRLLECDPVVHARLAQAQRLASTGDAGALVMVATQILDLAGGPLRSGYRRKGQPES